MDPKDQFRERYEQYLESRKQQTSVSDKRSNPLIKFYVMGAIVGIIILGPLAGYIFLSQKILNSSNTSQIVSTEEEVVVSPRPTLTLSPTSTSTPSVVLTP